ncbi:LysR family transcriptional regulator [Litorisediminicola beolgyonensis]|uniref:LysR family transcriptional regulator n=1 Tax=Litorisediminicola beolgyonensis TaxID=1173614 RepID=A0ABW3ZGT7_9RHOB
MRNFDLTALRSFVTVAETGGVTRAANLLNLTQSAVSMQLKRLEESLGLSLLDRSGRGVSLTASGEQLLKYGRKMLAINDEAWGRLTAQDYEGELRLGVPNDIIYPVVPQVLKRFAADFPRMRVRLISAPTRALKAMFGRGECDLILTTEDRPDGEAVVIVEKPLVWVGAEDGQAWKRRPLPVASCSNCVFRDGITRVLDESGLEWERAVESELDNAVEAAISADLGVAALIEGNLPPNCVPVAHGGALPDPGRTGIALYTLPGAPAPQQAMAELLRQSYAAPPRLAATG